VKVNKEERWKKEGNGGYGKLEGIDSYRHGDYSINWSSTDCLFFLPLSFSPIPLSYSSWRHVTTDAGFRIFPLVNVPTPRSWEKSLSSSQRICVLIQKQEREERGRYCGYELYARTASVSSKAPRLPPAESLDTACIMSQSKAQTNRVISRRRNILINICCHVKSELAIIRSNSISFKSSLAGGIISAT